MKRLKTCALMLALLMLFSIGGVNADWMYLINALNLDYTLSDMEASHFVYIEGDEEMVTAESVFAENFTKEINDPTSAIHTYIENRQDKGSWFMPIGELAVNDPAAAGLKELLELTDYPEITAIIKFTNTTPAYELYTTRVNVEEKDENGNYVIPDSAFDGETTFIYPVNKTVFRMENGKYVPDNVSVGYSRTIRYYETPMQKSDVRTFDVSAWQEGVSSATALEIETGVIDKEITIQNTETNKEVWVTFTPTERNTTYSFVGTNCTATIYNTRGNVVTGAMSRNNTYNICIQYHTIATPENIKFTIVTN